MTEMVDNQLDLQFNMITLFIFLNCCVLVQGRVTL